MLTGKADPKLDPSNQVSWQSAFWALVPIALNSMTQPSGKVLGMPSKSGFYLNSSPIVVTVDALNLLIKLVWRAYWMQSFSAAAQSITEKRFADVGGRHSGLAQLQEIKSVRLIVFVFGALPQIIKLYAMSGVLGTQICASLFFGSFLIIEAIMMLLNAARHPTTGLESQVTDLDDSVRILRRTTLELGYFFPLYLIVLVPWIEFPDSETLFTIWGSVLVSSVLVYTLFLTRKESKPDDPSGQHLYRNEWSASLMSGLLASVTIMFIVVVVDACVNCFAGFEEFSLVLFIVLITLVANCVSRYFLLKPEVHYREKGPTRIEPFAPLVFALLQTIAAVLTYLWIYSPVGTYKPGWTNQLG